MGYRYVTECGDGKILYREELGGGLYRAFCIKNNEAVTSISLYYKRFNVVFASKVIEDDGNTSYYRHNAGRSRKLHFIEHPSEKFCKKVLEGFNKPVNLEELPPAPVVKS